MLAHAPLVPWKLFFDSRCAHLITRLSLSERGNPETESLSAALLLALKGKRNETSKVFRQV